MKRYKLLFTKKAALAIIFITLAYGVKELAKLCVSRPRPYMYFDNAHKIKLMNGIVNYQSVILARYIKNAKILLSVKLVFRIIIAITVFGRLISGVHWTTDIAGGILLSWSLIEFYKKFYGII